MGDTTPEVKALGKLTSKYLTPCRTFGLKRRSTPKSDGLKKIRSENVSSLLKTKSDDEDLISRKLSTPRACLPRSDTENYLTPIKSCKPSPLINLNQTKSPLTPISRNSQALTLNQSKSPLTPISRNSQDLSLRLARRTNEETTYQFTPVKSSSTQLEETNPLEVELIALIKRVNEKVNRLEKLKQEEIYTKKHNLTELQKSTDKWLSTFKEVALSLHTELQARGRPCTLLDILVEHNISPERVGLNAESLEFD